MGRKYVYYIPRGASTLPKAELERARTKMPKIEISVILNTVDGQTKLTQTVWEV
jgi:hypothetical protein